MVAKTWTKQLNHVSTAWQNYDKRDHTNESSKAELDLANRSDDNSHYNDRDVSESIETNRSKAECPSSKKCSDGIGGLRLKYQHMPN